MWLGLAGGCFQSEQGLHCAVWKFATCSCSIFPYSAPLFFVHLWHLWGFHSSSWMVYWNHGWIELQLNPLTVVVHSAKAILLHIAVCSCLSADSECEWMNVSTKNFHTSSLFSGSVCIITAISVWCYCSCQTKIYTACVSHAAAAAVDQYLLQARAKPQQQTRWLQLSINGTDRWTDTQPFYDCYHIPCRPRNNHTQTENIITALVNCNDCLPVRL